MSRRATATKDPQPDLLGTAPAPAPDKRKTKTAEKPVVKVTEAPKPAQALAVVNPRNMLSALIEASTNRKVDVTKMEAILAMQAKMVHEQGRLDYIAAMRELQRKLPTINRDGKIEYKDKGHGKTQLRFASFENIHEVIKPLLDECGFELHFTSEPGAHGMINVIGHLTHTNGHERTTVFPMPHDASGGKSAAQGWASAFSFGKRIATIGLLNIVTRAPQDRDVDGANVKRTKGGGPQIIDGEVVSKDSRPSDEARDDGVPKITQVQHDQLVELLEAKNVTRKKFCEVYQVATVADLPADQFETVMAYVKNYQPKGR